MKSLVNILLSVLAAFLLTACESTPSGKDDRPVSSLVLQLGRESASTTKQIIHPVLTFESPDDAVFVTAAGGCAIDLSRHAGGKSALKIADAAKGATIRVGLAGGVSLPDRWPSITFRALGEQGCTLNATLTVAGQPPIETSTPLRPGEWTTCELDLALWVNQKIESNDVQLTLTAAVGSLWLDDVVLADNQTFIVAPTADELPWSISRRGHSLTVERAGAFSTTLDEERGGGGGAGWRLIEADDLRLVAESAGPTRRLTIYNDGRSFWDGAFKPLSTFARGGDFSAQHDRPATVAVPDEQGRLDQTSAGDANNDGYNEQTGDYRLVARGRRVDLRIEPRELPIQRSVFAVAGLPAGTATVACEGRAITGVVRLADGRVLFMLTQPVTRATTINVAVK